MGRSWALFRVRLEGTGYVDIAGPAAIKAKDHLPDSAYRDAPAFLEVQLQRLKP